MPSVQIIRAAPDRDIAAPLSNDLSMRGFATQESEPSVIIEPLPARERNRRLLVLILPHARPTAGSYREFFECLECVEAAGYQPVVVAREDDDLPAGLIKPHALVRTGTPGTSSDNVSEGVIRSLLPKLPPYMHLVIRPAVIQSPVGVTWWADDFFVSDEFFGHVARIEGPRQSISLAGLDQPGHLHLDRRKLLVTNKGPDEILIADVKEAGAVADIRKLAAPKGARFCNPNSIHQAYGTTAVADTDNNRVLITRQDVWRGAPQWEVAGTERPGLHYPCAVCTVRAGVWVADTFNSRLVLFDHEGRCVTAVSTFGEGQTFAYPVGLAVNAFGNVLIVADEGRKCLLFFRTSAGGSPPLELVLSTDPSTVPIGGSLPHLGTPSALSVNRENHLAVVDRGRRCIWLIDLSEVPELHADWEPDEES